ncbi:MAG TPA: hypothetical protein PK054_11600 [Anaerohalosphaeraceae bacterium]|nr:hypothetical protein [Anaerohalosphaeraceae bacterium]HOL89750.1 hypothetical protein [Anaerohalosphaeraceae bacterium]HPP57210.1 hypothetical protein [Anaerohalosphaeraceae bacterium]
MEINGVERTGQMLSMMHLGKMKPPEPNELSSKILNALDTDGDGSISSEELTNAGQLGQKIAQADTDEDGTITAEEILAKITAKMEEMGITPRSSFKEKPDLNALKELLTQAGTEIIQQNPTPNPSEVSTKILGDLDTNGDGVLSIEELNAAGLFGQKIAESDSDGNGVVSREELESFVAQSPLPPPPPPAQNSNQEETENSESQKKEQTGYDLLSKILQDVFGLSSEEKDQLLKMLQNNPFETTC